MAIKLYLDEDVDPLLSEVLRDRGADCLSTKDAGNLGRTDPEQLSFATEQGRVILTFNVKDFVQIAREYTTSNQHHSGIIVSNHLPFRELLRRTLVLLKYHTQEDLADQLLWLQDYPGPEVKTP